MPIDSASGSVRGFYAGRMSLAVRTAVFPPDATAVGVLVGAYLRQTETEKVQRGLAAETFAERYAQEIDDPATAFADRRVLLATIDGAEVGLVVASTDPRGTDLSRLWTDPLARGRGVGSALLSAAVAEAARPVRLSVWEWREPALRMYRAAGFEDVPSWDERPGLVCLELR